MTAGCERATQPEDLARLFVERANAGDAVGLAALYEPDAVLAYPPGHMTVGRNAIRAVYERFLAARPASTRRNPCPPCGRATWPSPRPDLAMTPSPGPRLHAVNRMGPGCGSSIDPSSATDAMG